VSEPRAQRCGSLATVGALEVRSERDLDEEKEAPRWHGSG
jgi:hypothetical protein